MEQDHSRTNSDFLDDQSRMQHMQPPNLWKRKFEEEDAPNADDRAYELRENPKKSCRLKIINRSLKSASSVQERTFKWEKELQPHTKNQSPNANKSFPCQICGSKFNSVRGLNGHMRIHSARTALTGTPLMAPPSTSEHEPLPRRKRSKLLKREESQYMSQFSKDEIELAATLLTLRIPSLSSEEPHQSVSDQTLSGSSPGSELKFGCKICHRRFASYQQLGGHQTSHRMSKGSSVKTESTTGNNWEGEDRHRSLELDSDGGFEGKAFDCETCGRVFSSGQALGGHKRAHWDKEKGYLFQQEIVRSYWNPTAPKIPANTGLLAL